MTNPRSIPLDELERQSRFAETEQTVLVGDGMGPPSVGPVGPVDPAGGSGAVDGDGD